MHIKYILSIYISVMYVINALQFRFAIIKLRFTTVNIANRVQVILLNDSSRTYR